jgi:hypothetical protein
LAQYCPVEILGDDTVIHRVERHDLIALAKQNTASHSPDQARRRYAEINSAIPAGLSDGSNNPDNSVGNVR